MSIESLREWIGREETVTDIVTAGPVAGLAATLDRDDPPPAHDDPLPPLWHWLFFLPRARQSELGEDGHPARGGFLPPVPLPRRMWAGGRLRFGPPLRVGQAVSRRSVIADVTEKTGRSGTLVFVLVRHEVSGPDGVAVTEEHDIVYRAAPAPAPAPAPGPGPGETPPRPTPADTGLWRRTIVPDPILLFRYSALTFNGHRIHYDRGYVTDVEGYPGLIVHGPLIVTLLMDLLRRNSHARVERLSYRAVRPLFDTAPFAVNGAPTDGGVRLWASDAQGNLAMEAEVAFSGG